jgi:hypothetical protein
MAVAWGRDPKLAGRLASAAGHRPDDYDTGSPGEEGAAKTGGRYPGRDRRRRPSPSSARNEKPHLHPAIGEALVLEDAKGAPIFLQMRMISDFRAE